ncbi:MAG: hypothetical protein LBQ12_14515 [Deltaproteobacteria bacterium]|jgi:hypothetical protein|nr:hypothetical protein [Deltaproteobacteria bacterium]
MTVYLGDKRIDGGNVMAVPDYSKVENITGPISTPAVVTGTPYTHVTLNTVTAPKTGWVYFQAELVPHSRGVGEYGRVTTTVNGRAVGFSYAESSRVAGGWTFPVMAGEEVKGDFGTHGDNIWDIAVTVLFYPPKFVAV